MPDTEQDDLHQKAVLWAKTSDDDYGDSIVSTGTDVNVRWEFTNEEVTDNTGRTIGIEVMAVVDQAVAVGSVMWLGETDDLPSPVTDVTDLYQVVRYRAVPDVKNRSTRRTLMLARRSDSLPTIA